MTTIPTYRTMKRRLLKAYESATPADHREGLTWYDRANRIASHIADLNNISVEQAAAVIAVISPKLKWPLNIREGYRIPRGYHAGVEPADLRSCALRTNVVKAYRIIDGDMSALSGPKVTAFYRNIIGDPEHVTIDRWAVRGAVGHVKAFTPNKAQHAEIDKAYRAVAKQVDMTPADFQAVVWAALRNR